MMMFFKTFQLDKEVDTFTEANAGVKQERIHNGFQMLKTLVLNVYLYTGKQNFFNRRDS